KTITVTVNEKPTIPDSKPENKPSNPNQNQNSSKPSSLPQTGDATNLGLLGLMFAGSGSMLLVLNRKKRKDQKKER
ncbi:TPA: LPXTG cell wall anchor domain-containing protein, partial [Clostridioides difficile]